MKDEQDNAVAASCPSFIPYPSSFITPPPKPKVPYLCTYLAGAIGPYVYTT
jgi:hypothetical protein